MSPSRSNETRVPVRPALVVGNYVNVVDGVSLTNDRLVRYLHRQGEPSLVLAPGARKPQRVAAGTFTKVLSIPLPPQPEYQMALAMGRRAHRALRNFGPRLVHTSSPDGAAVHALAWARRRGLPATTAYHSDILSYLSYSWTTRPTAGLTRAFFSRFYRAFDRVFIPAEAMRERLLELGVRDERIAIWGRGIDAERFSPQEASNELRRELGVGPDEMLLVFAARLRAEKGLDRLVEIERALRKKKVPHRLVIAGDGPSADSLRRRLSRAHFTGHLELGPLARLLASADLFVYPSLTETFGNVVLEAMASGTAVVAPDIVLYRQHLDGGRAGRLVRDRPADWAEAIAELGRRPDERAALAEAARARAVGHSWDRQNEALLNSWRELVGPAR